MQEYQEFTESVAANAHLSETTVNEISTQDVSDEKSDNAAQWMAEFEVIWNQMQAEQRSERKIKIRPERKYRNGDLWTLLLCQCNSWG